MKAAWDHQKAVVPRLLNSNFILIWEPGTGKTLPLLEAAKLRGGRALYLGPPAIRTQVAQEAQTFGCFAAKDIQVITSGKDRVAPQAKLVICSYDHSVDSKVWKQLFGLAWDSMILDEAHTLKNSAAKRTRAIYGARLNSPGALFRQAGRVWCATGTPVVNDPSDLWTHVSRLFPQVLDTLGIERKEQWLDKFCHVRRTPYGPQVTGGKNLPELKAILKSIASRTRKADVLELPPLHITQQWLPPAEIDLANVPEEALQELHSLLQKNAADRIERLAPALSTLRRRIGLAKARHAAELIVTELNSGIGKIIVFYQHTDVAKEMYAAINGRVVVGQCLIYSGGLSTGKRDAIVGQFTTDPKCRVLFAQIQAAGVGLNLQCADRVLLVEPAWTPALNEQAIARAYRAGQTKKVWASFLCLESSVDELITSALIRKQRIIEGAIG